ncbi:ABC transporter substrate-binding protein [Thalassobius vesicularis]|uniref:ABC transporter substrate-binding protein n=1 Tax=Thalassobius vesicularis TaxID=1294297 RepID=A0A4S3M6K6_9RHOB|nr:ABC transporter substrate-binding protein [Thalassobius vesicularis]THD72577.1 ABC transporter substrate-binding protein [Thalassobius vesicularis]
MKYLTTAAAVLALCGPAYAADDITVGFAIAKSGWMEAYDTPAATAAKIRIDEINANGGLLGRQIKWVESDTKTDRAQAAKAGLQLIDEGADMMVVSCDYDFGAPAALSADAEGMVSFFLCAEDVKAGIQGVGPYSFSGSVLAPVQGATMAEWSHAKRNARTGYVLLDTTIEYNKGICTGFDWMFPRLEGTEIVGRDTFKNDDASIASQISRIKALPTQPDVIMLCSYIPGAASAVRQLRAAGIESLILNGSAVDGSYWLDATPNLSNFVVPVQGSIYGDDPRPEVEAFNKAYEATVGARPASSYAYPGYVLMDLWAKAVERAGTLDGAAVTAELEKMRNEATVFGPRSFTSELHHQNFAEMQIIEITDGKPQAVDNWTISEAVPLDVLLK